MDFVYREEYIKGSRGVQLFTCRWVPSSSCPKALIFLCHAYGMECSVYMKECGIRLACAGYAVFGIDCEGHGRSSGSRCYIKKFENFVNDCDEFFKSVCVEKEYRDKGRFLYGEAMGGATALLLHRKEPSFYNGAVLVAPMCKISEKLKPHPIVVNILMGVRGIIPKWRIVPTKDVIDSGFRDPIKREKIRNNKLIYQNKPRIKTAMELVRTSKDIESNLNEVILPFLLLQGKADIVTDPEISEALYQKASSRDKTIKLYPGMWHGLVAGEPDGNVDIVFADIIAWLDKHTDDKSNIVIEPISESFHNGIEKITSPLLAVGGRHERTQRMSQWKWSSCLCGLKEPRTTPRRTQKTSQWKGSNCLCVHKEPRIVPLTPTPGQTQKTSQRTCGNKEPRTVPSAPGRTQETSEWKWSNCLCGNKEPKIARSTHERTQRTSQWKWSSCLCGHKEPKPARSTHGRTQRTSQWKWSGCLCGQKKPGSAPSTHEQTQRTSKWKSSSCCLCGLRKPRSTPSAHEQTQRTSEWKWSSCLYGLKKPRSAPSTHEQTQRTSKWKWSSCGLCGLKKPRAAHSTHGQTKRMSKWKWNSCLCGLKKPRTVHSTHGRTQGMSKRKRSSCLCGLK